MSCYEIPKIFNTFITNRTDLVITVNIYYVNSLCTSQFHASILFIGLLLLNKQKYKLMNLYNIFICCLHIRQVQDLMLFTNLGNILEMLVYVNLKLCFLKLKAFLKVIVMNTDLLLSTSCTITTTILTTSCILTRFTRKEH